MCIQDIATTGYGTLNWEVSDLLDVIGYRVDTMREGTVIDSKWVDAPMQSLEVKLLSPGAYKFLVHAIDHDNNYGAPAVLSVDVTAVTMPDIVLKGNSGNDSYLVRRVGEGTGYVEVFENVVPPASPSYRIPSRVINSVAIDPGLGQNTLNVDTEKFQPLADASLDILSGSIALSTASDATVLSLGRLYLAPSATFDVDKNSVVVKSAALDDICNYVRSAYAGGSWTGTGITSSAAKSKPFTGLAAVVTDQGDVVVKYTWNGDSNIDGVVNADDYFLIDQGFISQKPGWYNGDFNYDEVVNADDYFLIDSAYIGQSGPLAATAPTPAKSSSPRDEAHPAEPASAVAQPLPSSTPTFATRLLDELLDSPATVLEKEP